MITTTSWLSAGRLAAGAAVAVLLAAAPAAQAQETIKLTIAAGHPPIFLWVKHLKASFMAATDAELAKTGKYKIEWTEAYGGTLAKLGSELETMEQGISDVGIVSTVFQSSKMPLNNVTYFAPYGPSVADDVVTAIDKAQQGAELKGEWAKHNTLYLAGFAIDNYALFTKNAVNKMEDLNGIKLGGAGPNLAWFRNTGAVGVQGSYVTFYNDIKTGVYDGAIGFITASTPAKLFEVAPYYTINNMGAMYAGGVAMNKSRHDKLPDEVKAAIAKGSAAYRANYAAEQNAQVATATQAWSAGGGKASTLSEAERVRMVKAMPNPATEWLKSTGAPGKAVLTTYMDAVRANGFKFPRDFDKE